METASQNREAVAIHRLLDEIHLDIQAGISMDFSVGDQPQMTYAHYIVGEWVTMKPFPSISTHPTQMTCR